MLNKCDNIRVYILYATGRLRVCLAACLHSCALSSPSPTLERAFSPLSCSFALSAASLVRLSHPTSSLAGFISPKPRLGHDASPQEADYQFFSRGRLSVIAGLNSFSSLYKLGAFCLQSRYTSATTSITFNHFLTTLNIFKQIPKSIFNTFFKTITLALFASSAVFAASIPKQIEERQVNPSVQICSNKDYHDCDTINFHFGVCQNVGRLNDKVSSLKANGHNCVFYNDTGCRTGGGQIATKGDVANIRTDSSFSNMNDDVSSFECNF